MECVIAHRTGHGRFHGAPVAAAPDTEAIGERPAEIGRRDAIDRPVAEPVGLDRDVGERVVEPGRPRQQLEVRIRTQELVCAVPDLGMKPRASSGRGIRSPTAHRIRADWAGRHTA